MEVTETSPAEIAAALNESLGVGACTVHGERIQLVQDGLMLTCPEAMTYWLWINRKAA